MPEIGATLREARMRERIDVSEIEAKTKIRAKYLRALENEEWSLLPGPTFVKSFLRTYAQALGLDGKALVEEYRLNHERPSEGPLEPIVSAPQRRHRSSGNQRARRPGRAGSDHGPSRGYMIAVSAIGLVIVVLVVLLIAGGSGGSSPGTTGSSTAARTHGSRTSPGGGAHGAKAHRSAGQQLVALSLRASALVYVCLIGDDGRRLIPGIELQPGESTPTYHARRFEITLGNSSVTMIVDGIARTVPESSAAIGYSLTKASGRQRLPAGQLPTCT
ncbi:MAG TPA: helix-turn-helix domain-containing protein [Solirubrobacteraceae bacterium]|nr:helix-turn-helix domain-containing protein [Solirubrobacteraceae bacterium]